MQFQQKWTRFWQVVIVLAAALSMVATAMAGLNFVTGQEEPVARSYSVPVYMEQGGAKLVAGSGGEIEAQSGSTVDIQTGATFSHNNVTVSGPVRFGAASNVISGTLIAHGIGTTPTAVLLEPAYAGALTQTVYVLATNATSLTVAIEPGSVTTVTTVYWLAGK